MSAYRKLERRFARLADLRAAAAFLNWDSRVCMPPGAAPSRAEQMATIAGLEHGILTGPDTAEELSAASPEGPWQEANLREMRRMHQRAAAVPGDLAEARVRANVRAESVWREARRRDDLAMLLPAWTESLALAREAAACLGGALGLDPYDALLDGYDPGRRSGDVDRIFGELEAFLPKALAAVRGGAPRPFPAMPRSGLERVAARLMAALGLEPAFARLDVSAHPFSTGTPDDLRITTRYGGPPGEALMAVLHESGHALYKRGLPADWRRQPVGAERGLMVHESQSLAIEMQACRGDAFAHFQSGLLREEFGDDPAFSPGALGASLRHVAPGPIRVEADEVTYPAHVIVRYRCERELIGGGLDPADLPGAFDDRLEALLGIRPPNLRQGCLQDIHWPSGHYGYFPTYTLGALLAAQLFENIPDGDGEIRRGDFGGVVGWLREHVHSRGSFDPCSDDLAVAATGRPLDADAFRRHISGRYL